MVVLERERIGTCHKYCLLALLPYEVFCLFKRQTVKIKVKPRKKGIAIFAFSDSDRSAGMETNICCQIVLL